MLLVSSALLLEALAFRQCAFSGDQWLGAVESYVCVWIG